MYFENAHQVINIADEEAAIKPPLRLAMCFVDTSGQRHVQFLRSAPRFQREQSRLLSKGTVVFVHI